jgi:DNA-binding transcriptional regulator YhcF (GntR family)
MSSAGLRDLTDRLRDDIVGALHVGSLHSGDRLSSIREVARNLDGDPRAVARAYRILESEGLVEVRRRSGVFVAPQARFGPGILEETAEWMVEVLSEAWKRRIPIVTFPEFVRSCSARSSLRCAFVDSSEDVFETFGPELHDEFGLDVRRLWLRDLYKSTSDVLPLELREADLIVTTIFHAATVRTLLGELRTPLIILSIHPQVVERVLGYLQHAPSMTLVCVDPAFGDRLRLQYRDHMSSPEQLRVVLADDRDGLASLDRSHPVLISRAAHGRIGSIGLQSVAPRYPSISPDSAQEIIRFLVRANVQAGRSGS